MGLLDQTQYLQDGLQKSIFLPESRMLDMVCLSIINCQIQLDGLRHLMLGQKGAFINNHGI